MALTSIHNVGTVQAIIGNVNDATKEEPAPYAVGRIHDFTVCVVLPKGTASMAWSRLLKMTLDPKNLPKACTVEDKPILKCSGTLYRVGEGVHCDEEKGEDLRKHAAGLRKYFKHWGKTSPFKRPDGRDIGDDGVDDGTAAGSGGGGGEAGLVYSPPVPRNIPDMQKLLLSRSDEASSNVAFDMTVQGLVLDILKAAGEAPPEAGTAGYETIIGEKIGGLMREKGMSFEEALQRFNGLVRPRLEKPSFARGLLEIQGGAAHTLRGRKFRDDWEASCLDLYVTATTFEFFAEGALLQAGREAVEMRDGSWDELRSFADTVGLWGSGILPLFDRLGKAAAEDVPGIIDRIRDECAKQKTFLDGKSQLAGDLDAPEVPSVTPGTVTAFRRAVQAIEEGLVHQPA